MTDDLPSMRARLERLIASVYGNRVTGAELGVTLGEISVLRREIFALEQRAAAHGERMTGGSLPRA
jgi:hypothetical protein